jgi:ribose transport system substrate-binding protein
MQEVTVKRTPTAVAAACAAALVAAACGSNSSAGSERRITLVQGVRGDEFYVTMACGARQEARRRGVKLDVTAPDAFTPEAQTPVVTSVTAKRPDAVLVAPTDSEAMVAPLRQMRQAGIRVVQVDTTVKDPSVAVSSVATDNVEGGRLAARTLARLVGDRGSVLVINVNPGISTTDARAAGFADELARHPRIAALPTRYTNDDPSRAASIVTSTLSAHPDLVGIFATNVRTAGGAATGLRNAGARDRVKIVSFDASPKNVEDLRQGVVQALVAQQPFEIGVRGVDEALAALDGRPTHRTVRTGLVAITRDTLDDPATRTYLYRSAC